MGGLTLVLAFQLPHSRSGPSSAMVPEPPAYQSQRYQPYSTLQHRITKGRYITSNDPRGYVYVANACNLYQLIVTDVLCLSQAGVRVPTQRFVLRVLSVIEY